MYGEEVWVGIVEVHDHRGHGVVVFAEEVWSVARILDLGSLIHWGACLICCDWTHDFGE